jgi:hypothetical protein
MKAVNKFFRTHTATSERVKFLADLGYTEKDMADIIAPRWNNPGFPSFSLRNSSSNLLRMKQQLEYIKRKQAEPLKEQVTESGIKFVSCPAENRVRLFFPGKPAPEVISQLKSGGFRWTPSLGCWQAYHNTWNVEKAKKFAGITD